MMAMKKRVQTTHRSWTACAHNSDRKINIETNTKDGLFCRCSAESMKLQSSCSCVCGKA